MPTFKSAKQLGDWHRKRMRRVQEAVAMGHQEIAMGAERHARLLTSGSTKTSMLRHLDHPFARRHGKARLPLTPINMQRGRLQRGWRVFPRRSKGDQVFVLRNLAPYAKYVLAPTGTRTMLRRNFWKSLRAYIINASRPRYRQALRRANRSTT